MFWEGANTDMAKCALGRWSLQPGINWWHGRHWDTVLRDGHGRRSFGPVMNYSSNKHLEVSVWPEQIRCRYRAHLYNEGVAFSFA